MDVYKYVNSKDVREYLRSIEYIFSGSDAAWIVERCVGLSLEEKISAWKEIMQTMPDCKVVSPYREGDVFESFYAALTEYIDQKESLLEGFQKKSDKDYYEFDYKYDDPNLDRYSSYIGPYESFDECVAEIRKDINTGGHSIGYYVRKSEIGFKHSYSCEYSRDEKLLNVSGPGHINEKDYYRIEYLFINMWPEFPVPFKKGDILRYASPHGQRYERFTVMTELRTVSKDGIDIFGHEEKIRHLFGYFQTGVGSIYENPTWGHYIDFEFCPEEVLKGKRKILLSLSNYIKGKIPLECFVNDYHLIMLTEQMKDIRTKHLYSGASVDI